MVNVSFKHFIRVEINKFPILIAAHTDSYMLLQCKLCPALFTSRNELNEHFDLHFVAGRCGNCEQQLIVINEQFYYLQLHDASKCNKENLIANCNQERGIGTRRATRTKERQRIDLKEEIIKDETASNDKAISRKRNLRKKRTETGDKEESKLSGKTDISKERTETKIDDDVEHFEIVECMEIKVEQEAIIESRGDTETQSLAIDENTSETVPIAVPAQPVLLTEEEFKKLPSYRISAKSTGEKQLREYQCDICEKYLLSKRTLAAHMKLHQPGVLESLGNNICDVCGKVLKSKNGLKSHKDTHLDARRYICSYCGKGFRIKNNMIEHTNTHTGTNPSHGHTTKGQN